MVTRARDSEDNIYFRRGELATSNRQLVARLVALAAACDRPVATPDEARALLGISGDVLTGSR